MALEQKPTLLVMAAGMGNRYGGLKQMDGMGPNDETLLDYSVFDALRAGFGKVVFIIRHDFEEVFKQSVVARFPSHLAVELAFQDPNQLPGGYTTPATRTKPWGTTHAVLSARDIVKEPFAVINADDFYGEDSYASIQRHWQSAPHTSAVVGFTLRNTLSDHGSVARGVCTVNDKGELTSIVERPQIEKHGDDVLLREGDTLTPMTGNEPVSMNMWAFEPSIFPLLEESLLNFLHQHHAEEKSECFLPNTVGELVTAGKLSVNVLSTTSTWFGVTYREDRDLVRAKLAKLIESGAYPEKLWS